MNLRVVLLLSAGLSSCTASTSTPAPASAGPAAAPADAPPAAGLAPAAAPASTTDPPAPSAATSAADAATPAADAAPTSAPPVALPPAAPPDAFFQLAAYRDGPLALQRLGDDIFVVGGAGLAHLDARGRLVHLEYGLSGQEHPGPAFDRWDNLAFGGRWPDDAWLVTEHGYSRATSPPLLHRRDGDVWRRQANKDRLFYWHYSHFVTWRDGQVLGLRAYTLDPDAVSDYEDPPPRVTRKIEAQRAALRLGFDVLGPTPTPAPMLLPKDLVTVAVAAAPTGEIFMLAYRAGEARSQAVHRVLRWGLDGPAAAAGALDTLPALAWCDHLAVRAADDAYVGCKRDQRSYLLRFDGTTWSEEPAPEGMSFHDLSVAPDGAVWAIVGALGADPEDDDATSPRLWRRPTRGAAWEAVPVPQLRFPDRASPEWYFHVDAQRQRTSPGDPDAAARAFAVRPQRVLARAADDVWVAGDTELTRHDISVYETSRHVVLRSRPATTPLRMLPDGDLALELLDWRPARAWKPDAGCLDGLDDPTPAFVTLRTLPRDAPRDQPEPALEAFLRDNKPVLTGLAGAYEVHRRGRRALGLFITPPDQAAADALIAAIQRAFPDERAALECRNPRIRRAFDPTTGRPLPLVP